MVAESLAQLTTWLHDHPTVAIFFAGFVAFIESFAIIGSIVPGSVTLTAIGVLIGTGVIPLVETFIASIIGAILGDSVSYWIGHHYKHHLLEVWPFKKYPKLIHRGEAFFHKHGGKSIFFGRFFGPIRAVLPLVAGMLNMNWWRFFLADVVSGIFWAPSYMLPGVLIGAATVELSPEQATWFVAMLLAVLIVIILITWLLKKSWYTIYAITEDLCLKLWKRCEKQPATQWICHGLANHKRNHHHMQLARLLISFVSLTCLVVLGYNVIQQGIFTILNQPIFHLLQNLRTPLLDNLMIVITILGDKYFIGPFALLMTLAFMRYRQRALAIYWITNIALVTVAATVIKFYLVNAPRPTGLAVIRETSSFPSFHTALATATYSFLSLLILQKRGQAWRNTVFGILGVLLLLIGFSRLYLGAHWFTDVVGGYLLGLTTGLTLLTVYHRCPFQEPERIKNIAWLSLCCMGLAYIPAAIKLYPKEQHHHQLVHPQITTTTTAWWQHQTEGIPTYRRFRDGTPAVLFNLQWRGQLSDISNQLIQQGWQLRQLPNYLEKISRLAASNDPRTLPVFEPLFQQRYPDLTLTKSVNPNQPIIVLHLWRANVNFSDSESPLWIGTVHYNLMWHHRYLPRFKKSLGNITAADQLLLNDIGSFRKKIIPVDTKIPLHYPTVDHHNRLLLIQ